MSVRIRQILYVLLFVLLCNTDAAFFRGAGGRHKVTIDYITSGDTSYETARSNVLVAAFMQPEAAAELQLHSDYKALSHPRILHRSASRHLFAGSALRIPAAVPPHPDPVDYYIFSLGRILI